MMIFETNCVRSYILLKFVLCPWQIIFHFDVLDDWAWGVFIIFLLLLLFQFIWFSCLLNWPQIVVHGLEYGFGAHDYPTSGVFEVEPKKCPGFVYRCSIMLGHINIPPYQVREFIEDLALEYHGDTYHLISKNCNHFTDYASNVLTGRSIPGWVNRLARLGNYFFFIIAHFVSLHHKNSHLCSTHARVRTHIYMFISIYAHVCVCHIQRNTHTHTHR